MKTRLLSLSALTIIIAAASGTARADVPGWCKVEGEKPSGNLTDLYSEDDARDAVVTLVAVTCYPDDEAKGQSKQIEAMRKKWSATLNMTEADWADAALWAHKGQWERNGPSFSPKNTKAAWSTWGAIDQYAGIVNSMMLGGSDRTVDPAYLADAFGAKLTQAGRLGFITRCLAGDSGDHAVRWGICQPDIDAYDPKALAAELRADTTRDGFWRMAMRFVAWDMAPRLAKHAEEVKELLAKDPGYPKIFALAKSTHTAWATKPKYLDLMAEVDDARITSSRKLGEACLAKTWTAWQEAVAAIPAKQWGTVRGEPGDSFVQKGAGIIAAEPAGYLATLAMQQCHALNKKDDYLVRVMGGALSRWPGFRGPRTATHTAILQAGIELDDRDARLEYPAIERPWIEGNGSSGGGGEGVVASVKVAGDIATVTFKKEKVKQTICTKGHYTNRVVQITSSGSLIYQYICTAEKTEVAMFAPAPPQKINAKYAGGLKPGMFVTIYEDVLVVAYAKSGAAAPVIVGGVVVK